MTKANHRKVGTQSHGSKAPRGYDRQAAESEDYLYLLSPRPLACHVPGWAGTLWGRPEPGRWGFV